MLLTIIINNIMALDARHAPANVTMYNYYAGTLRVYHDTSWQLFKFPPQYEVPSTEHCSHHRLWLTQA